MKSKLGCPQNIYRPSEDKNCLDISHSVTEDVEPQVKMRFPMDSLVKVSQTKELFDRVKSFKTEVKSVTQS